MIFLTVGTQVPFNRLVRAFDEWCDRTGYTDVFGQIAIMGDDDYRPRHFRWERFVSPRTYREMVSASDVIVAHAGMGSIITAMMHSKPILLMPRLAALNEQRNDHQLATVRHMQNRPGVNVAMDEGALGSQLDLMIDEIGEDGDGLISPYAEAELTDGLRRLILS